MLYKVFAVLLVWLAAPASAVASTKLAMEVSAPGCAQGGGGRVSGAGTWRRSNVMEG